VPTRNSPIILSSMSASSRLRAVLDREVDARGVFGGVFEIRGLI